MIAGLVAAAVAIAGFALLYASFGRSPAGVPSAALPQDVARVDLVEAGIRAVAHPADVLFIETSPCRPGQEGCPATPLTTDEQRTLADRLRYLSSDVRFVPAGADIPANENPDAVPGVEFVFLGIPQERSNGTFWIEANVICKGACNRGGATYVLEQQNGVWTSTGRAPGTFSWGTPRKR